MGEDTKAVQLFASFSTEPKKCSRANEMCEVDPNTVVTTSSRGCRTRRLRECNGERAAASSVLLLPFSAITNPPAQRGDYGKILLSGEAFSPAVDCNRLLMMEI
ncbi:jg21172 [Pararge aegeria aegeria]|uniref:Jg21172 protein n=1 Tax=Pararge aegeria aegeria TaxID=348720 RepID=A0A8S4SPP1_9NEOP|nr:jg21172 [Pararge aegeria aegeria]